MGRDDVIFRILLFVALSFLIAFLFDVAVLWFGFSVFLWGFSRMWGVALSVFACLVFFRDEVLASFKMFLGFSKKAVVLYFLAPLIVYGALGLYVVFASPFSLFDFGVYVGVIADSLREFLKSASEEQIISIATTAAYSQIVFAYVAAITINAFFALGEEIGWRGYLYTLLGSEPNLKNVVIVGVLWGLWHASAIILLGHNYVINRYLGVLLFTLLTTALTYPYLAITRAAGSVLPASSLHGSVNALWGLTIVASNLPAEQKEIFLGLGLFGIVTWVVVSVIIYFIKKTLTRRTTTASSGTELSFSTEQRNPQPTT